MNLEAIQFQTILLSLNSKKTILAYNKEKDFFCTFGKGEVLKSEIYETKKELVDLRIYDFVMKNRKHFLDDDIQKFKGFLTGRITQLEDKINGKFKRYFYIFISLFPFTTPQSARIEEKKRLDDLIFEIETECFDEFEPDCYPIPASSDPDFSPIPSQQSYKQANQDSTAGVALPLKSNSVEPNQKSNPPPFAPPIPPGQNIGNAVQLLPNEPFPPKMQTTVFKHLKTEELLEQIEAIKEYKRISNEIIKKYKTHYDAIDHGIANDINQGHFLLKETEKYITDCQNKINFFKEKLEKNSIVTLKNGASIFHLYPLDRANQILRYNNIEEIEYPNFKDSFNSANSQPVTNNPQQDLSSSSSKDLNTSSSKKEYISLSSPTAQVHSSSQSSINKSVDWTEEEEKEEDNYVECQNRNKIIANHLLPSTPPPQETGHPSKEIQNKMQSEMKLLLLEKHIEDLEKNLKGLMTEREEEMELITALEMELEEKENEKLVLTNQNNEITTMTFSKENAQKINALLERKTKNIQDWDRYQGLREKEIKSRQNISKKEEIKPPKIIKSIFPSELIEEYPQLTTTACPKTLIKVMTPVCFTGDPTESEIYENTPFYKFQPVEKL